MWLFNLQILCFNPSKPHVSRTPPRENHLYFNATALTGPFFCWDQSQQCSRLWKCYNAALSLQNLKSSQLDKFLGVTVDFTSIWHIVVGVCMVLLIMHSFKPSTWRIEHFGTHAFTSEGTLSLRSYVNLRLEWFKGRWIILHLYDVKIQGLQEGRPN